MIRDDILSISDASFKKILSKDFETEKLVLIEHKSALNELWEEYNFYLFGGVVFDPINSNFFSTFSEKNLLFVSPVIGIGGGLAINLIKLLIKTKILNIDKFRIYQVSLKEMENKKLTDLNPYMLNELFADKNLLNF